MYRRSNGEHFRGDEVRDRRTEQSEAGFEDAAHRRRIMCTDKGELPHGAEDVS